MDFEEMTSQSLDEGQDSGVLITKWNWHLGTRALSALACGIILTSLNPGPQSQTFHPPGTTAAPHSCCITPQRGSRAQTTLLGARGGAEGEARAGKLLQGF